MISTRCQIQLSSNQRLGGQREQRHSQMRKDKKREKLLANSPLPLPAVDGMRTRGAKPAAAGAARSKHFEWFPLIEKVCSHLSQIRERNGEKKRSHVRCGGGEKSYLQRREQ